MSRPRLEQALLDALIADDTGPGQTVDDLWRSVRAVLEPEPTRMDVALSLDTMRLNSLVSGRHVDGSTSRRWKVKVKG